MIKYLLRLRKGIKVFYIFNILDKRKKNGKGNDDGLEIDVDKILEKEREKENKIIIIAEREHREKSNDNTNKNPIIREGFKLLKDIKDIDTTIDEQNKKYDNMRSKKKEMTEMLQTLEDNSTSMYSDRIPMDDEEYYGQPLINMKSNRDKNKKLTIDNIKRINPNDLFIDNEKNKSYREGEDEEEFKQARVKSDIKPRKPPKEKKSSIAMNNDYNNQLYLNNGRNSARNTKRSSGSKNVNVKDVNKE